jgi:hypothetical protein
MVPGNLAWAGSICATVDDAAGEPLSGAVVRVLSLDGAGRQSEARTDSRGRVCIDQVADGIYSVEASSAGFMKSSYYPVRVSSPNGARLAFRLPVGNSGREGMLGAEITLEGALASGPEPLSGVRICLFPPGSAGSSACTVTNALGQYSFSAAPGIYRVEIKRGATTISESSLDATQPGEYRDRILMPAAK